MKKHNKKRNVGIIYEQIISFICDKTIENDEKSAKTALSIVKESFAEGTQLNKEYKLFNALVTTRDISSSLSTSIINESKKASNYHFDEAKLEFEKSLLIKKLNHSFGKGKIFERKVENYTIYATIQTLLNEWRSENKDIQITSLYESKLQKWMISNYEEKPVVRKVDPLVRKIMKEKFSKKYESILNEDQKETLRIYFENIDGNCEAIKENFDSVKAKSIKEMNNFKSSCNNSFLMSSYNNVLRKVKEIDTKEINETTLKKIMTISKLQEEISGE